MLYLVIYPLEKMEFYEILLKITVLALDVDGFPLINCTLPVFLEHFRLIFLLNVQTLTFLECCVTHSVLRFRSQTDIPPFSFRVYWYN